MTYTEKEVQFIKALNSATSNALKVISTEYKALEKLGNIEEYAHLGNIIIADNTNPGKYTAEQQADIDRYALSMGYEKVQEIVPYGKLTIQPSHTIKMQTGKILSKLNDTVLETPANKVASKLLK